MAVPALPSWSSLHQGSHSGIFDILSEIRKLPRASASHLWCTLAATTNGAVAERLNRHVLKMCIIHPWASWAVYKNVQPPRPNLDLRTLSCTRSQQLALHIVCLTWGRPGPASPNVEGVTQCSNRMRMKAIMLEWGDRRVCVTCYNVCPLFFFHYGFFDNLVQ